MAYIMSMRNAGAGSAPSETVLFNTVTEIFTAPFEFPLDPATIVLTGATILGVLAVNYQDKILTEVYDETNGDYVYSSGTQSVILRFDDDPANYANGEIVVQVTYAYYA